MKISSLLLSLLISFAFAQCDSSEKTSKNETSSEETFQSPPEPKPAPSPGSVVVKGKIVSIDSTSDKATSLNIQLTEIEAYGAGTPKINTGTPVKVAVSRSELNKYINLLNSKSLVHVVLSSNQQQTLEGMEDSALSWRLNSVIAVN